MRFAKGLIVAAGLLLTTGLAHTQAIYANVTATVVDPNTHPLANALYTISLIGPAGNIIKSATSPNGQIVNTTPITGTLDPTGAMSVKLVETNTINVPSGTLWTIVISSPPLDTQSFILTYQPPWTITYASAITGDVDFSSQLSALTSPIYFVNLKTGQNTLASAGGGCTGTAGYIPQIGSTGSGCVDSLISQPNSGEIDMENASLYVYQAGVGTSEIDPGNLNVYGTGGMQLAFSGAFGYSGVIPQYLFSITSSGTPSGTYLNQPTALIAATASAQTGDVLDVGLSVSYGSPYSLAVRGPSAAINPGYVYFSQGIVDSGLTPGTSPICANGTDGALSTSGCTGGGGSSITLQTNSVNNGSQSLLNLIPGTGITLINTGGAVTVNATGTGVTGAVLLAPSTGTNQYISQTSGTAFGQTPATNVTAQQNFILNPTTLICANPGWDVGNNGTSGQGWSTCGLKHDYIIFGSRGISQDYGETGYSTAIGDRGNYKYWHFFGGNIAASDEAITTDVLHATQMGYISGPVTSGAGVGPTLLFTTASCNGDCNTQPNGAYLYPDGGLGFDRSQNLGSLTLADGGTGSYGIYYDVTGGTVPVSTAWGTFAGGGTSVCTNNSNGQYQNYTNTTCTITLGTSPASPGHFVAGTDVCLVGAGNLEEAAVVSVTPGSTTDSVTFATRYAYNNGQTVGVMQGGVCGDSFTLTSQINGWPVSYFMIGSTSSTRLWFGNLDNGGIGGNTISATLQVLSPIIGTGGVTMVRASNVVTVNLVQNLNPDVFPVGTVVTVTGAAPSDLNGTFTITANTYDKFNPQISWAQTGANESASAGTVNISSQPNSISYFPSAWIIGTNGGVQNDAQLATNHMNVATGDVFVGAPAAQYQIAGHELYIGQTTSVTGSQPSLGYQVSDSGPSDLFWAYGANNNIANGAATEMFDINGSYNNIFYMHYRPANNGCILCVYATDPVSSNAKPYYLFAESNSFGSILYNAVPTGTNNSEYTFGNGGGGGLIANSLALPSGGSGSTCWTTNGGTASCAGGGSMTYPAANTLGLSNGSANAWATPTYANIVSLWSSCTSGYLQYNGTCNTPSGGGTVTAVGVTTANGVSGTSSGGSTPSLTLTLGAITPSSVASTGAVSGTTGTFSAGITSSGSTHGLTIPAGTAVSGAAGSVIYASDATSGYAEVNENNTGLSRICTAGNAICTTGAPAFSGITSGTNTAAAMVVGSGASLAATGTGTVAATSVPSTGITGTLTNAQLANPSTTVSGVSCALGGTCAPPVTCGGSASPCFYQQINPTSNATTTITSPITTSATSIPVGSCSGMTFAPGNILLASTGGSTSEFMVGVSCVGTTLTVGSRGYYGSTAQAFTTGAFISQVTSANSTSASAFPYSYTLANGAVGHNGVTNIIANTDSWQGVATFYGGFAASGNILLGGGTTTLYSGQAITGQNSSGACGTSGILHGAPSGSYSWFTGGTTQYCTVGTNLVPANAYVFVTGTTVSSPGPSSTPQGWLTQAGVMAVSSGYTLTGGGSSSNCFHTDGSNGACGGGGTPTVTTLSGTTPAITLSAATSLYTITLSGNTTPTISGIAAGYAAKFQICQPSSGGPYTWTWPASMHGGITIGTTASACSEQTFDSFSGSTLVASSTGVINVLP